MSSTITLGFGDSSQVDIDDHDALTKRLFTQNVSEQVLAMHDDYDNEFLCRLLSHLDLGIPHRLIMMMTMAHVCIVILA